MKKIRGLCLAGVLIAGSTLAATAPVSAEPTWDISVTKVNSGPASIVAGGSVKAQFTVSVHYTPPPPTKNVQEGAGPTVLVNDMLPDGLLIDTIPADCTKVTDNFFGCTVTFTGDVEETKDLVMTATAPAWLKAGTYTNCVNVLPPNAPAVTAEDLPQNCMLSAPGTEPASQQVAGATVEVTNDADLQLTASAPGQVDPGKTVPLTWTVVNAGPSVAASPLTLTATLPAGVTFVSASPGPWQCTVSGAQVTCTYVPPSTKTQKVCAPPVGTDFVCDPVIFPGESIPPVTWTVSTANPGTVSSYSVQAKVSSTTPDSKPNNNATTPVISVTPVDLAVAKSAGSPVFVGDEATWTVTVSNVGTIADRGKVTVTDTLPTGAVFKSATGAGWTCSAAGQVVTCTDDDPEFAAGTSEEIVVVSQMDQRGTATNEVKVATTAYEKNLDNNAASKAVSVRRSEQTAAGLPASPRRILSGRTEQGQKLTTRVRCIPVKASVAGEVSYCKVRKGNGVVRVKVFGTTKMRVKVVQTAKGTNALKPFVQRKTYVVKP